MEYQSPELGIITEQGYVAGMGLGYTPTNLGNSNEENKKNEEKQGA